MGSKQQAAHKIKEITINQMKINDYKGAWNTLHQAKNPFPAYRNLDHMLFVCNVLKTVDVMKPGYGVNWLQILCLPPSQTSTIQSHFLVFIECLEAIKSEFPGADRVHEILRAAMRDCCDPEKDKEAKFQPVARGMENANDGVNRGSVGASKEKVHAEIYYNRRITRNSSSAKQSEILGSVGTVTKNPAPGRKFHVVGDHSNPPQSEVCDLVNTREEGLMDIPKIMETDSRISAIAGSITVEEIDDETSQYESSNNGDGQNQLVKGDRQEVTETPGSTERKTGTFSAVTEENYSSPELKALFEAMPQSPHYRSFSAFGEKFRGYLIMGIELGFMAVADQIRSLADAELVGQCNVSTITSELMYLETMGYDVQRLRARLEELCQLAEQKQAKFEAYQRDSRELEDWKTQREALEAKSLVLHHSLAWLKGEIQRMEEKMALYQSAIDMQKAKEAEIELRMCKAKARLLDSEIERIAKLPW